LKKNKEQEINDAYIQGLIGLAAMFFVIKDWIQPINKEIFQNLIIFFVIVSLIRVFGVILDFDFFNLLSGDLFAILLFPYTLYVGSRIFLTEIFEDIGIIILVPAYIMFISMMFMISYQYKFEIKIHIGFKRKKEESE
jgi:hypothetical protein